MGHQPKAYFGPFIETLKGCGPVLELAFGQGHVLEMLREEGVEATGVELDPRLYESAKQRGLNVVNQDLFDFLKSAKPQSYGGCIASHIIEHLFPVQVEEMFSLVHKVLKPGSKLVIITPNIANIRYAAGDFWDHPTHLRPYPLRALSDFLKGPEWEIISSGELMRKPLSRMRKIRYAVRNTLFGRYWIGDDIYVVASKLK